MSLLNPMPSLVFVHGFGGGPEDWDPLRHCLPARIPQVAITLPGHGNRRADGGPFQIERCAALANKVVGEAPAILIGHSMGARIAIEAACRRPDLIVGLVLVDGSNVPAGPNETADAFSDRVAQFGFDKAMDWTLASMLVEGLPAELQRRMYRRIRALPPRAARAYEVSMAKWDRDRFHTCLTGLTVPVKVIQSTSLIPSRGWARLPVCESPISLWLDAWRQVASADVYMIEGCGHYVMMEKPNRVSRVLTTLLTKTSTAAEESPSVPYNGKMRDR